MGEDVARHLQPKGLETIIACSAKDFYKIFNPDVALAIINTGLADQSGLALVKFLSSTVKIRIIVVSENSSSENRIEGYKCGGDLFLPKPINCLELGVIVSNMLRRFEDDNYKPDYGGDRKTWRVDSEEWSLITPLGEKVRLTGKEYDFINCLAQAPKGIVSKVSLLQSLGYIQNESGHRALEALVYRIRKKISPTLDTPIKTANGSGYTFTSVIELDG
jgi:DNA-binding response OmpR family regulator